MHRAESQLYGRQVVIQITFNINQKNFTFFSHFFMYLLIHSFRKPTEDLMLMDVCLGPGNI